ncbi:3-hydroxyacyl-CoA dehydrogenase NAD-binding domain-containing protein [Undibacterium fentianense]|uniref:Enoyl-CoA hydratase/isomerase family protein n=1 Tax=Undibacterium fentianense TaxID=2828728 RepID=A0A941IF04_9BURK|nr:3-hydroxyacyl-CoA dehydrogenase NAD-binding domain-containing protein [Undibacterium fentianense]MBR7798570.1 enoyl-CoA hydratase/isomerase family protein [Undibacterium fentianense]
MSASIEVQDHIAIIYLNNPPVNGLGHATRSEISSHLRTVEFDSNIHAVILTGVGKAFSGGADIKEFGTDKTFAEPSLPNLLEQLDTYKKPIIAAINGVCMGGGLELALACHYRVATQGALIALPEVKLGILPGAGGTQRLPRLLNMDTCVDMIVNGHPLPSSELAQTGLFDLYIEHPDQLLREAINFAIVASTTRPVPRVRDRSVIGLTNPLLFSEYRTKLQKSSRFFPAPFTCLDVLEAALKQTFEEGLKTERAAFQTLLSSPESKALRHIFMAERAASKIAGVDSTETVRAIAAVAVVGAGTMGTGIAMCFANANIPVQVLDSKISSLENGLNRIRETYLASFKKGKLSQLECEHRIGLIQGVQDYTAISEADLVIEAVFEEMPIKREVFEHLDRYVKSGAILASNTSTLDLNQIASFTKRPHDVVGLHFFSPANRMELLEVVRGQQTSTEVLASCAAIAKRIRKIAIIAGVCDGFIGNRMLEQYTKQAAFLLEEGCTPQQVDQAMEAFGFAMGPFRMNDLAGNDISWAIRKRRLAANPQLIYSKLGDILCEQGRFGQKSRAGWYDYHEGDRTAYPSIIVEEIIRQHANALGIPQRQIGAEEIVQRLVLALANEGRKILLDKIAARSSDIDLVYLKGYGFPAYRGGPMFYAEQMTWDQVDRLIRQFQTGHRGNTWTI